MSRIIVKELPKQITEQKLRQVFGAHGTITDLQMKYTPDGKFRQFCFIGYSSEAEAQHAIKHFNNSYIQTRRIRVESCVAVGGGEKTQKSFRNNAKEQLKKTKDAEKEKSAEEKKKLKNSKLDEILGKHKDDPEFQEFLQAHDKTRSLWANDAGLSTARKSDDDEDDAADEQTAKDQNDKDHHEAKSDDHKQEQEEEGEEDDDEQQQQKLAEKPISDLEYMKSLMAEKQPQAKAAKSAAKGKEDKSKVELFTIKIQNVPYKAKRQDVVKFFKPLKPYSIRMPSKVHGFCYVGFKTEESMAKAMIKDKSFIRGKQVFFTDFTERNKLTKAKRERKNGGVAAMNGEATGNAKWREQEESIRKEEDISESGRIFFRNLTYNTTEEEVQKLFERYGPIVEINLPVDKISRQIKGYGTVTYMMPEHAVKAFNDLDYTEFHGRVLHLMPCKDVGKGDQEDEIDMAELSFKEKKDLKLKQNAQKPIGWNTLFLGPNVVADLLAKQFKTSKERILDTSAGGSGAAVRLALGETQIVNEMKEFLEKEGVRLSAFDNPVAQKRSKTVLLAKNLPASTEIGELTPIFSKFGPIGRIVLPPSGVTALIEYCEPSEARHAFKKLAYTKFKSVPLFLEWAPEDTFTRSISGEAIIPKTEDIPQPKIEEEPTAEPTAVAEDANDEPEPNTTIFLRNLNFKTVLETVRAHFESLGSVHTVEIAKRKNPENPQQERSLGYGFIQFKKAAVAAQALKDMQFTKIDGNLVELKRSDRVLKSDEDGARRRQAGQKKQTGTKILVRNIPFQAKHREVLEIFKTFGELRSVRIPKKMTPGEDGHRGFGFVDYNSKADAKRAFEALSASTHLYGRRLALDWASVEDQQDVGELRKRTAEKFEGNLAAIEAKRSRRAFFDVDGNMHQVSNGDGEDDDI